MGRQQKKAKSENHQQGMLPTMIPWAVIALAGLMPLVSIEGSPDKGTGLLLSLAWILLLILWSATLLLSREPINIYWNHTETIVSLMVLWLVVSVWSIQESGSLRAAVNGFWDYLSLALAYFLARQTLRTTFHQRTALVGFVSVALLVSCYGLYQYQIEIPQTQQEYLSDPSSILISLGIDPSEESPARKLYESRLFSTEPVSTFTLANSLAGFLATWSILLATILLSAIKSKDRKLLIIATVFAVIILACLLVTKSRTAWLALLSGLALWFLYVANTRFQISWKIPAAAAACSILLFAGSFITGLLDTEVLSEAPKSLLYRLQYWEGATQVVQERPLLGTAPGNFRFFYPKYMNPAASETISDPHNFVMEIISTAGIPWLLLAFGFAFFWVRQSIHSLKSTTTDSTEESQSEESSQRQSAKREEIPVDEIMAMVVLAVTPILGMVLRTILLQEFINPFILIGWPLVFVFLLWSKSWIFSTEPFKASCLIGIITLLINLCAAGGISFPGVAISLSILLALTINGVGETSQLSNKSGINFLPVCVGFVLFFTCVYTAYLPCSQANYHMQIVENAAQNNLGRGYSTYEIYQQNLLQAAQADPWSEKHKIQLASLYFNSLQQSAMTTENRELWYQKFNYWCAAAINANPRSHVQHATMASWNLSLYRKLNQPQLLEIALGHAQQTVELFPSRAEHRAELAWIYYLLDQNENAAAQAEEALRLDKLHDHAERKLAALKLSDTKNSIMHESQKPNAANFENIEQAMLSLRNEANIIP